MKTSSFFLFLMLFCLSCTKDSVQLEDKEGLVIGETIAIIKPDSFLWQIPILREVPIADYFCFMDTIVQQYDSLTSYPLSEHLLAHANAWLIDSLAATDYYIKQKEGVFLYDQPNWVILQPGDSLGLPGPVLAYEILERQANTWIDVNIPEFRLRIMEGSHERYSFPVRVGRVAKRYLATAGREVDTRTHTGEGYIFNIVTNPLYINPVDGHVYTSTQRDDKRRTKLPQIPFLHTEIDGHRWGELIHPTTNPNTLGKAYSNGCIGTSEAAAWLIYYHAPIGTKIKIRYDLQVIEEDGDSLILKDIYQKFK